MASKLEEFEATFRGTKRRFDLCIIGTVATKIGDLVTIKGDAEDGELSYNCCYRFYGRWTTYKNKFNGTEERQFAFNSFVEVQSHDRTGIVAYLLRAGEGRGLGKATANKLFDVLGTDAVRTIRENPRELIRFSRTITPEQCDTIGLELTAQKATEDATIELTNLLHGRGFPKSTARNAIKKWGNRASRLIARDPYKLRSFSGCGFRLCDRLYLELGLQKDRIRRQGLKAWDAVKQDSNGSTWIPAAVVASAVSNAIGDAADPIKAIKFSVRLGRMSPRHYAALEPIRTLGSDGPIIGAVGDLWLAEKQAADDEAYVARSLVAANREMRPQWITTFEDRRITSQAAAQFVRCYRCGRELTAIEVHILDGKPYGPTCITNMPSPGDVMALKDWIESQPPNITEAIYNLPVGRQEVRLFSAWPEVNNVKQIDDHQRTELAKALSTTIGILTGSPGTGKTHTVGMLVRAILALGLASPSEIAIGCPTAKAAVRVNEFLSSLGLPVAASTWHSLLEWKATKLPNGERVMGFCRNEFNKWPYRIIIGDEMSMVDSSLMRSIFAARPRGCHFLLVGDVNQLPPVGSGAPLRDIIASGLVGCGELTEIKRSSGGIVEACAAIRDGQPWVVGENLTIDETDSPDAKLDAICKYLRDFQVEGYDPVWDSTVIVAVNGKSPLSRKAVNQRLQDEFNRNPEIAGSPFRLDDKVVCLKNGSYQLVGGIDDRELNDDTPSEVFVANGEVGRVVEVGDKTITVQLSSPNRTVRVPRGKVSEPSDTEGQAAGDESSGSGCDWDLAYGVSAHKAQGTESPIVAVVLDEYRGARRICSREWLYVAISRARIHCRLFGRRRLADAFCQFRAIDKRKTLLREQVLLEETRLELEGVF